MNVIFVWSLGVFNAHTSLVVLLGYILPFVINAFEFTLRTIKEYRNDLKRRTEASEARERYAAEMNAWNVAGKPLGDRPHSPNSYNPTLTLGHVLARLLGIFTPFINFIVMICNLDRVFEWIGDIFRWMGQLFDIPLVPKR